MSGIMQGALLEKPLVLNDREMASANLPAHVCQLDFTTQVSRIGLALETYCEIG